MTTSELERYESSSMTDRMEYAKMIAQADDLVPSGFHDPVIREINGNMVKVAGQVGPVNAGKVFLAFEYGAMLGLHPLAALMGIHVIEGKPAASAGLISSLVRTAGHRLRVTTKGDWEDGTFEAKAELTRADDPDFTFTATWTRRDAERAKLLSKDNWAKYPASMAKARAITAVAREGAEEALLGVHYTPEELGAAVDSNGEVIVVQEGEEGEEGAAPAVVVADEADKPAPRKRATNGRQGTKRKTSTAGSTTSVPMDAPETPQEPAEDVVDAEVVVEPQEDSAEAAEREERARIAAEQEAAARAADEAEPEVTPQDLAKVAAAKAADAKPGETEVQYQQRKLREHQAQQRPSGVPGVPLVSEGYPDLATGVVYETADELTQAIKERVQAKRAAEQQPTEEPAGGPSWDDAPEEPGAPTPYELAREEEPENWERMAKACRTQAELLNVWNDSAKAGKRDAELAKLIMAIKPTLPEQ